MEKNLRFYELIGLLYFYGFFKYPNSSIAQINVWKFAEKMKDFREIPRNFQILLKRLWFRVQTSLKVVCSRCGFSLEFLLKDW